VNVLGIWDGHDSGAALLQDGRLRFAVNEERFTRRKLEIRFPSRSIDACLAYAGLSPDAIDVVAVSTSDPAKTFARWWPWSKEQYYAVRRRQTPPGPLSALTRRAKYAVTEWKSRPALEALSRAALRRPLARHGLSRADLRLVDHHAAHAAAAACASGFGSCAVITIDGVGDGLSSTISVFDHGRFERVAASPARASLGIFFEHVTNLLNMRELEDEGKVMALADYAAPIADEDNPLLSCVRVRDGVIDVVPSGFALRDALARVQWRFPNEQFAYLAQRVVEQTCMALARDAVRLTGQRRLALAGGVASNVRATRRIRTMPEVDEVYVFPHMGDGGLAVGAAALAAMNGGSPIDLTLASARRTRRAARRSAARARRTGARGRPRRDVVRRAHGVWAARARTPQRAGAARSTRRARSPEPGAQAAGLVSALLSQHARERGVASAQRLDARWQPCDDDGLRGGTVLPRPPRGRDQHQRHLSSAGDRRHRAGRVRRCAARSPRTLGHRRRPEHELQHPRGADGLFAGRRDGRVPARGR
jgi:hypothetical protein